MASGRDVPDEPAGLMNLRVWHDEPFVRKSYGEQILSDLESDLAILAESGRSSGEIVWGLRQLAYQRAEW